ncbi:MAG: PIG-L family deacetylase [Planctomycetota bacterium]|nr:PIG-L family deacetylase [Planctomycetota bacterium]MDA1214475.1 PIG-L family deacetylase [Planctomycetota bacterium]
MPERNKTPRILAIHAHPDDVEFQCAGTLVRLKQLGCPISIATMTAGDCGSAEMGPLDIARVRRQEAKNAADLLGADCYCLEFLDLAIVVDNDSRRRVTEIVRKTKPDIVLTAPATDYMSDHEFTSRLVRDACFNAAVPNYTTNQPHPASPLDHIPYLYYVDPIEGIGHFGEEIEPEFIVDISETFDLKQKMLACHESQRNWLRKQHGIDEYLQKCERWSAQRGSQIGTKYGEGYRQHKGHPYPGDNLLVELLSPSRS